MERILAQSNKYLISHEYETVCLKFIGKDREIIIGDFYGDPETGFISNDESYCVIGGCGLIVYFLKEPFIEFEYNKKCKQWIEFFRNKEDIWWISGAKEGLSSEWIKFKVDPNDDKVRAGNYELNVYTLELKKLDYSLEA